MNKIKRPVIALSVVVTALFLGALSMTALAFTAPGLGTTSSFAVLAHTTVTNTGLTVITGDLGLSPGSAVTGMTGPPNGTVTGTQHVADATAVKAQDDLRTAYLDAAGQTPCTPLTGDLGGGRKLPAGLYCYTSDALLTGTLTLTGSGPWVFQIGSQLTTASNSTVSVIDPTQACDVFWQIGSSAVLGTATTFVGTIMALTSITLDHDANILPGRALARNGEVALDTNKITAPTECNAPTSPTATPTATPSATPTPTATPTATPAATASPTHAAALATTGGGPAGGSPWMLVLIAGGIGVVAVGLTVRVRKMPKIPRL
ncbi:MAG TPA: ice-binding family protein [Bryobacteraceae bacterium]|jgi:type VI secretion system secreted protein VgrG|nr:ice-binding family protein [Bryobacteraceae bacterium]